MNAEHAVALYGGRIVCTCGDFNCASLDYITEAIALIDAGRPGEALYKLTRATHRQARRPSCGFRSTGWVCVADAHADDPTGHYFVREA